MYGGSYAVNLFKQKLYHKKTIFLLPSHTTQQSFLPMTFLTSSLHKSSIHISIEERYVYIISQIRSKRTPFRKNVLNEISRKSNLNRTTWLKFCDGSFAVVTPINCSVI